MSFGGSPTAEESRSHMVYKRASQGATGRVRKLRKVPLKAEKSAEKNFDEHKIGSSNRNMTSAPRMIKFEVEDAKFSEAYEQLKKSRKLRNKRSPRDNGKNATVKMEKFMTEPDTFMQPKEFLRFLLTDAITSQPLNTFDKKKSSDEKKTVKREVSDGDSSASDTFKKVKISHPLSSSPSRTKHVSFDDLPSKLQKMIESALNDAVLKGKANDGDYLKIYYGDRVIKIPVSMSKYIKVKETTTTKAKIESYGHKTAHKYMKDESESSKNTYYQFQETPTFKYESKYLPSTTEKTEKATSYVNFVTPKDNAHIEEVHHHLPPKKSIYYFLSDEDTPSYSALKNTLSSPSPVVFLQSSTPKAVTSFSELSKNYENHIIHPTSSPPLSAYKTIIKEAPRASIPITEEEVDDTWYKPIKHLDLHNKPIPVPLPSSYIGFTGSTAAEEHEEKNYEFG